jgi:hypothetical protein
MITVAIITLRLKEGKTYEDFRRAWYHTVGCIGSTINPAPGNIQG